MSKTLKILFGRNFLRRLAAAVLTCSILAGCNAPDDNSESTREIQPVRFVGGGGPADSAFLMPTDFAFREGHFVIADRGGPNLRIVSRDGQLLSVWGGRGSGPGEFRSLLGLAVFPDGSIAVGDAANERVTIFDSRGRTVDTWSILQGIGAMAVDRSSQLHLSHRGPAEGQEASIGVVSVFDSVGNRVRSYGRYEPQDHPVADHLHNEVRIAHGPDDSRWLLYPYRGVVEHLAKDGDSTTIFSLPVPDEPGFVGPYVQATGGPGQGVAITRIPVADDIAIGKDGRAFIALVLQDPNSGEMRTKLAVYSSAGKLVASYGLPHRVMSLEILEDSIYGLCPRSCEYPGVAVYVIDA